MSIKTREAEKLAAKTVEFRGEHMYVHLQDGRTVRVPVNTYARLRDATEAQRDSWELIARGTGIHWEEIDEDLSVSGLVRDFAEVQHGVATRTRVSKSYIPPRNKGTASTSYNQGPEHRSAISNSYISNKAARSRPSSVRKEGKSKD
jgi:hypothetical protein